MDTNPDYIKAKALNLYRDGWRVISRKYNIIARLPPGKSGLAALVKASREPLSEWGGITERRAADQFRRVYARSSLKIEYGRNHELGAALCAALRLVGS